MKIAIGNDHAALELKNHIVDYLVKEGHEVVNFGTDTPASTDYPIYGARVAHAVANGECERGVVICGTGIGISISANKVKGIRCALCSEPVSAKLTRQHNDANVISIGARQHTVEEATAFIDAFIAEPFSAEERHARRIAQLAEYETTGVIAGHPVTD